MKIEYAFIKSANDFCNDEESFKSYLMANSRLKFHNDNIVSIDKKDFKYELKRYQIEQAKEDMFYLAIAIDLGSDDENANALGKADELITRINVEISQFHVTTIYDEVSMYYEGYLYPKMSKIENTLRKLIYLFMMKKVGSAWYKKETPPNFKDSIDKTREKNQIDDDTNALMYANFITLDYFFFTPYSLNSDSQRFVQLMDNPENRKEKNYKELRKQFEKKSNWDRYFSDKIDVPDFDKKWIKLYQYRNDIAHSKKLKAADVDDAMSIIESIQPALEKCISNIDEVKLNKDETDAVQEVAKEAITIIDPAVKNETIFSSSLNDMYLNDLKAYITDQSKTLTNELLSIYGKVGVNQLLKDQVMVTKSRIPIDALTTYKDTLRTYGAADNNGTIYATDYNRRFEDGKPEEIKQSENDK